MPVTFLNGSAPSYLGQTFTTATELIDLIESTLVTAGWTTVNKVSGTSLFIRGVTTNSHNCWVDFVISGSNTLTIRGWLEAAKTNGSPDAIHTATFTAGSTNRLWITADQDAGCLCLFNASGACVGYHFGFLDRVDNTDANAWMIGRLHASGIVYAYVARSRINNTIWRRLGLDFHMGTSDPIGGVVPPTNPGGHFGVPINTFDFVKRLMVTSNFVNTLYTETSSYNAGYLAYNGGLNYDGNVICDRYGYLEGRGSTTAYGSAGNNTLYFRGFAKFAYCGVASLAAAAQAINPITPEGNSLTYRILSVGGTQWQGMRIT